MFVLLTYLLFVYLRLWNIDNASTIGVLSWLLQLKQEITEEQLIKANNTVSFSKFVNKRISNFVNIPSITNEQNVKLMMAKACLISLMSTFSRQVALSVCRRLSFCDVGLCIVAKRCVLEQKLLLTAYRKSYSNMRDWFVPKWMTFTFV